MKSLATGICLFLSLVVVTNSYAAELTEEAVKEVISRAENAINDLNAKALAKVMSDNVSITLNIDMQGQKQVIKLKKQEYISMIEQGWAVSTNYKYSKSNLVVKIKGNKAYVSANVHESMTIQGKNISATSKEEVIMQLVNGRPLVTKLIGYTSM